LERNAHNGVRIVVDWQFLNLNDDGHDFENSEALTRPAVDSNEHIMVADNTNQPFINFVVFGLVIPNCRLGDCLLNGLLLS